MGRRHGYDLNKREHEASRRAEKFVDRIAALIDGRDARLMWVHSGPPDTAVRQIQCYLIGSNVILVEIYEDGAGFEIFPQSPSNDIERSVAGIIDYWRRGKEEFERALAEGRARMEAARQIEPKPLADFAGKPQSPADRND